MRTDISRRGFLAMAGAATLIAAQACSSNKPGTGTASGGAVTIKHIFGETTIPAPPKRVVSAGFTEQDSLLAVGVVPIAITDWWGGQPFAVWPWATPALGGSQPTVLSLADGIQVDSIGALKPDLIIAINAGCDADTYQKLSAIAPTVPQTGQIPFFEPWKDQANTIGAATFQSAKMAGLIKNVDDKFAAVANAHPQFKDKRVLLLQGSSFWENNVVATQPGWRTDFLTSMGFKIAESIGAYARENDSGAYIPLDRVGPVLDDADLLIWITESDADQARLLADPNISGSRAMKQNRYVFTDKDLAGAIAFSSVLSYPVVADRLPPLLAKALR